MPLATSAFNLPEHLSPKADPSLIAADEERFAAIGETLEHTVANLEQQLEAIKKAPSRFGQEAVEKDIEIRRLTGRLKALKKFGLDLCLGRVITQEEPLYIGRLGLTDSDGQRLLVDWRSPAAEPFFGATHANPMGLASRRRYRWTRGRITDYWDDVFGKNNQENTAALEDLSAFIASLGTSRSAKMRDVLGTIQADQDSIIRASSRGALVVDGGPGTGKTVVALHRAAYLLYSDPKLEHRRGGVLFIGPHRPYLNYVADVLPNLGEEGVQTCTIRDLVPEGASAAPEPDTAVVRLKSTKEMVKAIERAIRLYEEPPKEGMDIETPWADVWLSEEEWAEAFSAPSRGTPHNEARDEVWDELVTILLDKFDTDEIPEDLLRRTFAQNTELREAFTKAWPLLDYAELVADLWRVPAFLKLCAPWLAEDETKILQRANPTAWTIPDLPLLDAARQRLGDPEASIRRNKQRATAAAEKELMDRVVEDLIAADDSELMVMSMLRGEDMQEKLTEDTPVVDPDVLAGPFAHIMVDEAQELTDAEWQMLLQRCPSRSFTVVGDRAQARHGFRESWEERLERVGLGTVHRTNLTINYRTPEEVMAAAEPVIRKALPDANVPSSIRSGPPVRYGSLGDLGQLLTEWLAANAEGTACVIATHDAGLGSLPASPRIRVLLPELVKGLEFDLVVLVDPDSFGAGIEGAVDRYVAMTRATQQLVILNSGTQLPAS
ncbi:RNA polymerase recycling motor ATPase HelR [Paenarthrobacter sp. NPDC058040]|uniref:RNA polymerase recycling motor ATPase HelR n=1 Tax=unclassified Paenarthrobacter TaxID=2634190 RepID=UPI0036DE35E5